LFFILFFTPLFDMAISTSLMAFSARVASLYEILSLLH
jgi:hypothetical protein